MYFTSRISFLLTRLSLGVAVVCAGCNLWADQQEATEAKPAQSAGLTGAFIATAQHDMHAVFQRVLPGVLPGLQDNKSLYIGQEASLMVFVGGYALSAEQQADVTYALTVLRPDGSPDSSQPEKTLFKGHLDNASVTLFQPDRVLFRVADQDPEGDYTLRAEVRDLVSGRSRTFEKNLAVIKYSPPQLPATFDANTWMMNYYRAPSPGLALPALKPVVDMIPADKFEAVLNPIIGFYDRVLADNEAWLLPHFLETFQIALNTSDPEQNRNYIKVLGQIIGYHLRDAKELPPGLELLVWREQNVYPRPSIDGDTEINSPIQLDILWGRFLASGDYTALRRIASALMLYQYKGALEKAKDNPEVTRDIPPEAMKELVYNAAVWSLGTNAQQHDLVRWYLEWMLANGDGLDSTAREILRNRLSETLPRREVE